MEADVFFQRQTYVLEQHLAHRRLSDVGHNREQIEDEYDVIVVGEKVESIAT